MNSIFHPSGFEVFQGAKRIEVRHFSVTCRWFAGLSKENINYLANVGCAEESEKVRHIYKWSVCCSITGRLWIFGCSR